MFGRKSIRSCIAVLLHLLLFACPVSASVIPLGFSSLPGEQGWNYYSSAEGSSTAPTESEAYSVSGGVLTLDTLGMGVSPNGVQAHYSRSDILANTPFTLSFTARIFEEDPAVGGNEGMAFAFRVYMDDQLWHVSFAPGSIYMSDETAVLQYDFNTTVFHDYVFSGSPGTDAFMLTVDGTDTFFGSTIAITPSDKLMFGDITRGTNAHGEITSYVFEQVPIPSAIWLLGSGLTGLIGFRRKIKKV